jgi:hypothetical protein
MKLSGSSPRSARSLRVNYAHPPRDAREQFRLRLAPEVSSDGPEPAREDEQRSPAFEEELRAARRDRSVVATEDEYRVGPLKPLVHPVILPEPQRELAYLLPHSFRATPFV